MSLASPSSPITQLSSQPPLDIEDICHVCEPVSVELAVTAFPMKFDRKKVREELDIVNVVEWRQDSNSDERFFLLVRRPETGMLLYVEFIHCPHFLPGLLAGLYDFATSANISKRSTTGSIKPLSLKYLGEIFGCVFREDAMVNSDENSQKVELARVSVIGDVSHVFSHVKKTYRVVWTLMTGGDRPPMLRKAKAPRSSNQPVRKFEKNMESQKNSDLYMDHSWILFDQVANAT